jgi:hypothetical protein
MQSELDDLEFRLGRELEEHFDESLSDPWGLLFRCKYSQAKWLRLPSDYLMLPLEFYYRALNANKHIIYVLFDCDDDAWIAEMIRDTPSMNQTCIYPFRASENTTDPQFALSADAEDPLTNMMTFLADDIRPQSQGTFLFIQWGLFSYPPGCVVLGGGAVIVISFYGPVIGKLILRLRHRCYGNNPNTTLHISVKETTFQLEHPIPNSLTTENIDLHPSCSNDLSFEPNTRNDLIIRCAVGRTHDISYEIHDIQLLDEIGNPYKGQPRADVTQ